MPGTTRDPNEDSLRPAAHRRPALALALALVGCSSLVLAACIGGPGLEPPGRSQTTSAPAAPTNAPNTMRAPPGAPGLTPATGAAGAGATRAPEQPADQARTADAGVGKPTESEEDAGTEDAGPK